MVGTRELGTQRTGNTYKREITSTVGKLESVYWYDTYELLIRQSRIVVTLQKAVPISLPACILLTIKLFSHHRSSERLKNVRPSATQLSPALYGQWNQCNDSVLSVLYSAEPDNPKSEVTMSVLNCGSAQIPGNGHSRSFNKDRIQLRTSSYLERPLYKANKNNTSYFIKIHKHSSHPH